MRARSRGVPENGASICCSRSRCGTFVGGIPFVERLYPDERCRFRRVPECSPRAGADAVDRHRFSEVQRAHEPRASAFAIENLHVRGKSVRRHDARERPLDPCHQHVVPVRRRRHAREQARRSQWRDCARRRIDEGELAGEVVLEERVVMSAGEEVLARPERRCLPFVLLHARSRRHPRIARRLGATRWHVCGTETRARRSATRRHRPTCG